MKNIADLLARICISALFFYEAYDSIRFYRDMQETLINYNLTWRPDLQMIVVIIILILGSTLVLIGYQTKFAATLLLIYWIPVTFIVYSFWNDPPDVYRMNSFIFMRNFAVMGGLLFLLANGSKAISIRRLLQVSRFPRSKW